MDNMSLLRLLYLVANLYGKRNKLFLPTLLERVGFLSLGVGDLQRVIRAEQANRQHIAIACARCFSRIAAIYEYFWDDLPFIEMLCRKFPSHCAYCGKLPCQCQSSERPPYVLAENVDEDVAEWPLHVWAEHLRELYGESNKRIGIHAIVDRLSAEVSEFLSLAMQLPNERQRSIERIHQEFALELADIFSWTCAVANFYEVDFETITFERYGGLCRKCNQRPCKCLHFNFHPKNWGNEKG